MGFEGPLRWSEGSGLVAIEIELPDRWGKLFLLQCLLSSPALDGGADSRKKFIGKNFKTP